MARASPTGPTGRPSSPTGGSRPTLGQSYRLTDKPTLFPDGTGLTGKFSDWVGRTEVRYKDFIKFTHRYRVDKDTFAVRRNEIDATIGSDDTYAEVGYMRLNRDIDIDFEDLQDREEVRAAAARGVRQVLVGVRFGRGQPDRPRRGSVVLVRRLPAAADPARASPMPTIAWSSASPGAATTRRSPIPRAATVSGSISRCATSASADSAGTRGQTRYPPQLSNG